MIITSDVARAPWSCLNVGCSHSRLSMDWANSQMVSSKPPSSLFKYTDYKVKGRDNGIWLESIAPEDVIKVSNDSMTMKMNVRKSFCDMYSPSSSLDSKNVAIE